MPETQLKETKMEARTIARTATHPDFPRITNQLQNYLELAR
jgi:hypothetical protein